MTESEPEDLFDDLPEGDDVEVAPRPKRLLAIFGVALAGFVFIGVAGAALILFFVLRVRDHTDPNHAVRDKYTNAYSSCVRHGGAQDSCSAATLIACERDGWWKQAARAGQRETVCLATVPD
jgi:hypothetical protein